MATLIVLLLSSFLVLSEGSEDNSSFNTTGCYLKNYNYVVCNGRFNLSEFLRLKRYGGASAEQEDSKLRLLEIKESPLEKIKKSEFNFFNYTFEGLLIENAPNLHEIESEALTELKDTLTDFRAINTKLPNYNHFSDHNPFNNFTNLGEVFVGQQSRCPADYKLISPCKCEFGILHRTVPSGLYGTVGSLSSTVGTTTRIDCDGRSDKTDLNEETIRSIFEKISASNHTPKHFDVFKISGHKITNIPSGIFSNVSITAVWINDVNNLRSIHRNAFSNTPAANSVQFLQIEKANFSSLDDEGTADIFAAFSTLVNIRGLRLYSCGIPYIPNSAFVPDNGALMQNLKFLALAFDRREHPKGISSIGSYAFSGAPRLEEIGLTTNFIETFHPFAFGFNQSSNHGLTVHIGVNPFNDSVGLKPAAFSGAQRPLHIKYEVDSFRGSDPANDPSFNYMPENVFKPFLEEHPYNWLEVDYYNVDIWCDCKSRWMFNENGTALKKSVDQQIQIKRVADNVVQSEYSSIQCKSQSSFECFPACTIFQRNSLIHCGGSHKEFDADEELKQLATYNNVTSLIFSSKSVSEIPKFAFNGFHFEEVSFLDSWNLSSIHPDAFGDGTADIKSFTAARTSLTHYPNFGNFPNLSYIQLDDYHPFVVNSSNFDFTPSSAGLSSAGIIISINNGTLHSNTFSKLNNKTVHLKIGETRVCDTTGCLFNCQPSPMRLHEEVFRPFLETNPRNIINTHCYLECSCELEWLHKDWNNTFKPQVGIWLTEYLGRDFYCVPPGAHVHSKDNFWGIDSSAFDYGDYFTKHCSGDEPISHA